MATFLPFPRLAVELRIHVWSLTFTPFRILKVHKVYQNLNAYTSPTPPPAVTRANRESREHCGYRRAFTVAGSPHYIWARFDCDVVQMLGSDMAGLAQSDPSSVAKSQLMHLRIEVPAYEEEFFYHTFSAMIHYFPCLASVDILVSGDLFHWARFIEETYWGTCLASPVRIIDTTTGEWVDERTAGAYVDWIDTGRGETRDYKRIDDYWDENNEEDVADRWEAMMRFREGLPRIQLGPRGT